MSEYSKKLHIKYNNIQTNIKLYTTNNEVGNNYIGLYDGITNIYAKLDTTSGTNLHIKKNGIIYNVIKEIEYACPTGSYYNINIFDALHLWNTNFEGTDTFVCPAGVKIVRTV